VIKLEVKVNDSHFGLETMEITRTMQIKIIIFGRFHIFNDQKEGWRGKLPFYIAKCKKHGYFIDYPHGYEKRLDCPLCLIEDRKIAK